MAFRLDNIVPWGRKCEEYVRMFSLDECDLQKKILGCGDGPASFNAEMTKRNSNVVSVDPVYKFSAAQIRERVEIIRPVIMAETRMHQSQFVWDFFKDPDELERYRMQAIARFLDDFEIGQNEGRYIQGQLPNLPFQDQSFELSLVSHLLFLYSDLMDTSVHLQSIRELLRVSQEVRIFPLLNLETCRSQHVDPVINAFSGQWDVKIVRVDYEFQAGGNEMMVIKK